MKMGVAPVAKVYTLGLYLIPDISESYEMPKTGKGRISLGIPW
jgi:hypothetical protein